MRSDDEREVLLSELAVLNSEVSAVLAKRKAWMDAHMVDFARVQVGDDIYNLQTGSKLGTVSRHYRYWDAQQNPLYDTAMDVCYEYHTGNNCFDNTSRQTILVGTQAEAAEWTRPRTKLPVNWEDVFRPPHA